MEINIGKIKGIIFDIKRASINDGPGIRTTIFLKGCNLSCKWCHNPEGIIKTSQLMFYSSKCLNCKECEKVCKYNVHKFLPNHVLNRDNCILCGKCVEGCPTKALQICGEETTVEKVLNIVMRDKIFYKNSGGGITVSGGEPLCQPNFTFGLLKAAKIRRINTFIQTNGNWVWQEFKRLIPFIDGFHYDLKHMESKMHLKYTGVNNQRIIDNLTNLYGNISGKQEIILSLPLISNINDSEENINSIIEFVKSLQMIPKILVLPYNDFYISKLKQLGKKNIYNFRSPSQKRISEIKSRFCKEGITIL
jgi:pyruvate formate lyase activating enzyme